MTLVTTIEPAAWCSRVNNLIQPRPAWYAQGSPARHAVGKAVPLTAHERLPHDGSIVDPPAYLYHSHNAYPSRIQCIRSIFFFSSKEKPCMYFKSSVPGTVYEKIICQLRDLTKVYRPDRINVHVALSRGKVKPRTPGSRTPAGSDREARLMLCAPEHPDILTPIVAAFECNVGA